MKRKALLTGFMAVSLAFSSAVVPVRADIITGNTLRSHKIVADVNEIELPVEGMDGEEINIGGGSLDDDLPVSNSKIKLPVLNEGIKYSLSLGWGNGKYTYENYGFEIYSGEIKDSFDFKKVGNELIEVNKSTGELTNKKVTKIVVKEKQKFPKNNVKFPEFEVKYTDENPVEDDVEISIVLPKDQGGEHKVKVKNGKITPDFYADTNVLYTIGMSATSKNFNLVEVENSNGLANVKSVNVFLSHKDNKIYLMKPNSIDEFGDLNYSFNGLKLRKLSNAPLYTGPVASDTGKPKEDEIKDIKDDKTALGGASGAAVKGKKIKAGNDVKVADIEVVFEDGTKVPDGITLDSFRMKDIWAEPAHYKVKNGKISGIVMKSEEQYKIGFDVKNADYNNYEVVGAYKSKKLLRVYARYEGGVLLKYDYDEGIEAPEEAVSKIVIKKTDGKPSEQVKAISCIINLLLSDSGFQPEGKLPFRLIRKDNNKSKLIYSSDDGVLTLNGEGDVSYELKLEKNPVYKLKNKIEFSFAPDSNGTYQPVIKGYKDANNLEERLTSHYIELVRLDGKTPKGAPLDTGENLASKKYTLKDYKIIYNTKKVAVKELPLKVKSAALKKDIKFEIYNATKQRVEKTLTAKNGKLSGLKLVQGNDYIISAVDKEYSMKNAYVTISSDGKKLLKSKAPYGEFKGFELKKRAKALKDEKQANRVAYKLPVYMLGNNKAKIKNTRLRFISARETIEADVVDGWVDLSLLEDTNYVAEVVKGNYAIDAFPMTVKDKSEYGAKKYVFNHLSCGSVQALYLIDKKMAHKNDTVLLGGDGTTSATGFRFGNGEYTLSARVLKDVKVPELKGKKYMVLDVDTVNMYRVELSPLAYGQFKITTTLAGKNAVKNVYYIDDNNKLQKVKFTKKGDKLTFEMNSMGLYNNVIEYK